ncbi:hypothetical protein MNB_SV-3-22 [hydrothermal vent metagenome]|uniref:Antitoxin n=1 Tax=hydrothermal vent metagenome TaxID=652676 RepID=A0A1W1BMC0_9ZZZZ
MTITATQLKQQTYLLDSAIKEDIQVTKRDRPFVVIVDAQRYEELLKNQKEDKQNTKTKLKALEAMGSYALGGSDIEDIKASMYDD